MAYRETCEECINRKLEDERKALAILKPHPLTKMKLALTGLSFGPLKRIGILFGILGGLGASGSLWFVLPFPVPIIVWILQAFASLVYCVEADRFSLSRSLLTIAWGLIGLPVFLLWRLQQWIRTGE